MPLAIDLYCGLGGWAEGFLAEGWDVIGFDIERHCYGVPESLPESDGCKGTKPIEKLGWTQGCAVALGLEGATARPRTRLLKYPAQLVLQDVLTLHGRQFKDVAAIVASPPCQAYSWMAMPWSLAKREAAWQRWERDSPFGNFRLNDLFNACFRLQREASEAARRHIPMCVENVKGAQPWVGEAQAHFGSFYLWGDVRQVGGRIVSMAPKFGEGLRAARMAKNGGGGSWWRDHDCRHVFELPTVKREHGRGAASRQTSLHSPARKVASAMIAKIPFDLASHIAQIFKPASTAGSGDAWGGE